jgi:ATP-binding cassette subfamily B protein/subfamily B ATP-binding cassette protein MsbA
LTLAGVAFKALAPWPLKFIVDYVLPREPLPANATWLEGLPGVTANGVLLGWLAGATLLLFTGSQLTAALKLYIETGAATRMKIDLGAALFDRLQRLSIGFHFNRHSGDLERRITKDTDCIEGLVLGVILPAVTSVVTLAVMLTIVWRLDQQLCVVALIAAIPLPIIMRCLAPRITARSYDRRHADGQLMALAEQTITALPVVQAFCSESTEKERFVRASSHAIHAYQRTLTAKLQYKASIDSSTALGTAVIMVMGGWHVLDGPLTVGSLLVIIAYLAAMYQPLQTMAYLSAGFADAAGGARRVLEVLDSKEAVQERADAQVLAVPFEKQGVAVQLDQVTYA